MGVLNNADPTRKRAEAASDPGAASIDTREADQLREQAKRCRRLARSLGDIWTVSVLQTMAGEYETRAVAIEGGEAAETSSH
jgi:hypothetical protein